MAIGSINKLQDAVYHKVILALSMAAAAHKVKPGLTTATQPATCNTRHNSTVQYMLCSKYEQHHHSLLATMQDLRETTCGPNKQKASFAIAFNDNKQSAALVGLRLGSNLQHR